MCRSSLYLMILVLLAIATRAETTVTATGRADGSLANASQIAFTDAMREAVRIGVGVDVLAQTQVSDFQLDYDRIFAESFGYVRSYRIISQNMGDDEIFRVTIEATVGAKALDARQVLRMTIERMGAPRVLIQTQSQLADLRDQPDLAALLRELALAYQMRVVDPESVSDAELRRRHRDNLQGDGAAADWRAVRANHDFVIRVKLQGRYDGEQSLYGATTHRFVLGADLDAVWAASGDVVATLAIASTAVNSTQGARDAVSRMLKGEVPATRDRNADMLMRRIIIQWLLELDRGTNRSLEFWQIERASLDALLATLRHTQGIGNVHLREYDARGYSTLEAASRLEAGDLAAVVLKQLHGWQLDRAEKTYLQFKPAGSPTPPAPPDAARTSGMAPPLGGDAGSSTAQPAIASTANSLPPWLWALVGAGVVLLLGGVFLLGNRRGARR